MSPQIAKLGGLPNQQELATGMLGAALMIGLAARSPRKKPLARRSNISSRARSEVVDQATEHLGNLM
jgi:hypothetical protein